MIPNYLTESRLVLEMTCRENCQTVHLNDHALLCRVLGKYIMYAHPEDVGITPHLCLNGFWESWITIAMARQLKPGMFCLDIGANHGYYTLMMADAVGGAGRVLAVEPNPKLTDLLNLSIELNGFQCNAKVLQKAAFDRNSQILNFVIPKNRWMDATLCRQPTEQDEVVKVETITVDEMTVEWPHVDLIKIDAEGAEEWIWQGMEKTLKKNKHVMVIMEIKTQRYTDPNKFLHDIRDGGFPLRYVDYEGSIQALSEEEILAKTGTGEWVLFLSRN
jgi:FkbM family methyltransferase